MEPLTCYFCGAVEQLVEDAVDDGWIPSFWVGDEEELSPVCASCQAEHLREGKDGELELVEPSADTPIIR